MKKNNNLPIFIGLSIAFGIILGSFFNIKNSGKIYQVTEGNNSTKLGAIINYIKRDYVDEVDTDTMTEGAIEALLENLDPHSRYLSKEAQETSQETMNGNFVGIGVQFVQKKDTVVVVKVIPSGRV